MYANDSFFTLSLPGQFGLLLLSTFLTIIIFVGFWKLTKRCNIFFKLGLSVSILWLFVWLSPQIYYSYYLFLFDDLEFKNITKRPPTAADIVSLMTFSNRVDFSNHGKGLLGWGLIFLSLVRTSRKRCAEGQLGGNAVIYPRKNVAKPD